MSDIAQILKMIDAQGEDLRTWQEKHDAKYGELENTLNQMALKSARPGFAGLLGGGDGGVKYLSTVKGERLPMLSAEQKYASLQQTDDSDGWTIGGHVRDAVIGSRKASSGPAMVPTYIAAGVIDRVRQRTVLVQAGAQTIMIEGPTNMARLTGDPTVYQHTEAAVDISESDITATPVSLNPKLLAALVPLTVELVQDSPNLNEVLSTSIANAFAAKLDALGLATLVADSAIPDSASGQDPAVWAKVLEAVGAALALNQGLPTALISAPADFIARASQLASTAGTWLGKPPALASMAELFTTGLTAGTALFGDFAAGYAIAIRSELTIEVVRHAKATSASHLLVAHMRADGVVLQPGRLFRQLKTVA